MDPELRQDGAARDVTLELWIRVVEAYEAGEESYSMVAERFAIGEASVRRLGSAQAGQR